MSYQTLLHELAPGRNPAGIEASMCLHYGTLNHLPRETFEAEVESPGMLRKIADSMGMADDFAKWEASHVA